MERVQSVAINGFNFGCDIVMSNVGLVVPLCCFFPGCMSLSCYLSCREEHEEVVK